MLHLHFILHSVAADTNPLDMCRHSASKCGHTMSHSDFIHPEKLNLPQCFAVIEEHLHTTACQSWKYTRDPAEDLKGVDLG